MAGSPPSEPFKSQKIVLLYKWSSVTATFNDWLAKRNKKLLRQHSHHDVYGFVQESENMHLTRQLLSGLDYIHTKALYIEILKQEIYLSVVMVP
ncbi:hypothetical protein EB796_021549 [Bugula neritina]|uniref:Uncharacterized protein n=1 Tax=Bugula neritina TaxID=10212 RepID=A0A7J7J3G2_BUGNE|nr:hypothetical protein EB796_021549 [Bugula neritina]